MLELLWAVSDLPAPAPESNTALYGLLGLIVTTVGGVVVALVKIFREPSAAAPADLSEVLVKISGDLDDERELRRAETRRADLWEQRAREAGWTA